ncbi:hypothetical protein HYV83_04790 [Candidatus Woesearchaeota archaeon]|nr:hypothetical protein [Candidatus Woesearchaeota archaeon]
MNYVRLQLLLCLIIIVSAYGCSSTELGSKYTAKEEAFNYTVHFCSQDDCIQKVATQLHSAKESVKCAFYAVDGRVTGNISPSAAADIVVDENTKVAAANFGNAIVHRAKSKGIMHNKYCIIDNSTILTGSFNPTAAAKNDYNNIIIINSTALASFYSSNFEKLELSSKETQVANPASAGLCSRLPPTCVQSRETPTTAAVAGQKAAYKTALLNTTPVEVYFCPEDDCASAVIKQLKKANSSIIFASYSFTHPELANELIIRRSAGISVFGMIEKSTTGSRYSKHAAMAANGIDVKLEPSKRLMHHKFFVIDNETVITGSFNPTQNADERNDENVIIIKDKELAEKYLGEFGRLYLSSLS